MNKAFIVARISGAVAGIAILGSTPCAQGLEEIVVTAQRREESLQAVPIAVSVLTAEGLERAGVANISDLRTSIPSFNAQSHGGRRATPTFQIRGFRQNDTVLTEDPSVTVYVAEAPVVRTQGLGSAGLLDAASVEVLKGPQGTLFGRNTIGGAVLITPNEPQDEFGGSIALGAGEYDRRQVTGVLNVPFSKAVAGRIALQKNDRDGWLENVSGGPDFFDEDEIVGRAALRIDASDAVKTEFYGDFYKSDDSGVGGKSVVVPSATLSAALRPALTAYQTRNDSRDFFTAEFGPAIAPYVTARSETREGMPESKSKQKVWGISNSTTWEINDRLTLKNVAGYRKLEWNENFDVEGISTLPLIQPLNFGDDETYSEDLNLSGRAFGDRLDWIVGGYYFKEDGREAQYPNGLLSSDLDITNTSWSMYAQTSWHFTDQWSLTTGVRYTEDKRELDAIRRPTGSPTGTLDNGGAVRVDFGSETFSEPTWLVTLQYQIDEEKLLYLSHRHGYRAGGFNPRPNFLDPLTQVPYEPETVDDVELGYKSDLAFGEQQMRFNAAIFYAWYEDIIRNIVVPTPPGSASPISSVLRNAAKGTIWGGELEVQWVPAEWLDIRGYYAHVDASYDDFESLLSYGGSAPVLVDRSNNDFYGAYKHTANLTARVRVLANESVGELFVSGNANYQSKSAQDTINKVALPTIVPGLPVGAYYPGLRQGGYTLFNARIEWESVLGHENLSISAWGRNLGDKEYINGATNTFEAGLGLTRIYPGEPRMWGIDLRYEF